MTSKEYAIERYDARQKQHWDAFVGSSKNGTFLFARDYMDYHSNRFEDHSLIIRSTDTIVALLPANRVGSELHSHQGLTYGGLVISDAMTAPKMLEVFESLTTYLSREAIRSLHYKTVPWIYHRLPAEEDRYALFRADAKLVRRDVLSVIARGRRGPVQERRLRGSRKAAKSGIMIAESRIWGPYWALLTAHLQERYEVAPVHSLNEIELLQNRFPQNIRLFEARIGDDVVGGVVIFASKMVAHVQYVAASKRGRDAAALDVLFLYLIENVFADKEFFDFGISNEQEGRHLNRTLVEQKEGFGARAVVHDFYMLEAAVTRPTNSDPV